jgi:hypothetical protein
MLRLFAGARCIGSKLWQTLLYATRGTQVMKCQAQESWVQETARHLDLLGHP